MRKKEKNEGGLGGGERLKEKRNLRSSESY